MSRSMLCGVDGSEDSRLALRTAVRLAAELDARLVVGHVVQTAIGTSPRLGIVAGATIVSPLEELEDGRRLLDRMLEQEGLAGVEHLVVYGFPAERLADLADELGAELVVVGSRGRGPVKAALLGSVSTELVGLARCPVLVVPPGAAAAAPALQERSWTNRALPPWRPGRAAASLHPDQREERV